MGHNYPVLMIIIFLSIFSRFMLLKSQETTDNLPEAKGSYYTNEYEDLFISLLGMGDMDVNEKVNDAFTQLFYGDDSTQRFYYPAGNEMAFIKDILHNDVRSEGMSYGMMIAVQLNRQEEFNRLWKWAKEFMQHKSGTRKNYFAWQCRTDGTIIDPNPASDGEEWFVMALMLAANRWGNGEGIYNYQKEAQSVLDAMLNKTADSDKRDVVTNMFNKDTKVVVFVPTGFADDFTDPSYILPHFYELWALWADKNNQFWKQAAAAGRNLLKANVNAQTGLASDYAGFDGLPGNAPWGGNQQDFRYDAWRVAMNVAIDYEWFGKDNWAIEESNRLLKFFYAQGINKYGNLFTLDGRVLSNDHRAGLVAMNAAAALAANIPERKAFVEALWNLRIPDGIERYYDGMLYMLAMLQVSGHFNIYHPAEAQLDGNKKLQRNLKTFDK